jgi:UDP-N-acetylglucosamine--N-acetylmuramyl-(pentapeptide) pyrophosphoryl-undecaprenol N-acetylglucosamine transferase
MKILLTGGGTGGHFYPLIAVAQELNELTKENKLIRPQLYYMSTSPYNETLLYDNGIIFKSVSAGKIRRDLTPANVLLNIIDAFKTFVGSLRALWTVFLIYPDVVFGKGGYASFPALLAARILRIPVVIHESDTKPGKVSTWAAKFAERIAISYPGAARYFSPEKVAYTGNPIRKEIMEPLSVGAHEFLHLDPNVPTVFVLGGSTGAKNINDTVLDSLPDLVKFCQIIHQTGKKNIDVVKETSQVVLSNSQYKNRYKPFDYLNVLAMRMAAGASDLVVSRAGSTIFEIASWAKASIIIPIPEITSHDQRSNAFEYARSGAAEVIEEVNLSPHVFSSEIERLLNNKDELQKMEKAAAAFSRRDAARLIAREILEIAVKHEE